MADVRDVLGGDSDPKGTAIAEYAEDGPYHCMDCWYLKSRDPRSNPLGYCNEPHMLKDPKTQKAEIGGAKVAVVNKQRGCCRFVDPVQPGDARRKFIYADDLDEEAEEHDEVPSYKDGGEVEETGLAMLHKGEHVIPA